MADKPTYEELEQRVKELEKEAVQHKAGRGGGGRCSGGMSGRDGVK